MESVRMRAPALICVVAASALLVACSGGEPPPSAAFSTGTPAPVLPLADAEAGPSEPTLDGGAEPEESEPCPPRTKRECMVLFRSISGQTQHCTQSFQWCRGDGKGWHKCGFSVSKPPD